MTAGRGTLASPMKHYLWLTAAMAATFLGLFGLVEALDVELLRDPDQAMSVGGVAAAAVGVGLLVADVLIPVPSSLVMIGHGALFGAALGAALSLIGCLGAAWLGFLLGRRGGPLLDRLIPADQRARADELLERWGTLAIVVTRPIPIVAETVALLAGTSPMRWRSLTLAALAGSLPGALLFAITGATSMQLDSMLLVFALVLAIAGGVWWLGRRI
ncbi:MAG TPA: VTT domain-containing protein [Enhygromyxa sp.]|nr:VTT domain-containing protein [Enhygromyxa sp.]